MKGCQLKCRVKNPMTFPCKANEGKLTDAQKWLETEGLKAGKKQKWYSRNQQALLCSSCCACASAAFSLLLLLLLFLLLFLIHLLPQLLLQRRRQ